MVFVASANKGGGMSTVIVITVVALVAEYARHQIISTKNLRSLATTYVGDSVHPRVFEQPVLLQTSYLSFPMHKDMGVLRVGEGHLHFEGEQTAFSMPIPRRRLRAGMGTCVLRYPGDFVTIKFSYLGIPSPGQMKLIRKSIAKGESIELGQWFAPPAFADCVLLTPSKLRWRWIQLISLLVLAAVFQSSTGFLILLLIVGFVIGFDTAHRLYSARFLRLLKEDPAKLFTNQWFTPRQR